MVWCGRCEEPDVNKSRKTIDFGIAPLCGTRLLIRFVNCPGNLRFPRQFTKTRSVRHDVCHTWLFGIGCALLSHFTFSRFQVHRSPLSSVSRFLRVQNRMRGPSSGADDVPLFYCDTALQRRDVVNQYIRSTLASGVRVRAPHAC